MRFRASDVAVATGGRLVGPDVTFVGASFDSRTVGAGELFVPLVADRDGHEFVVAAVLAGATGFLCNRPAESFVDAVGGGDRVAGIEVDDTADALMRLAAWARRRLTAQVVGITGSVGKTSTKDLVAGALRASMTVTANERSFNNEQGLPVTVLGAPDDVDALVLEMGMRGFGQIRRLCDVARPSIGVVTAVGESHTALVGGIDGVVRAKRELVEALPPDGTVVLNADDARVLGMRGHAPPHVVTFGLASDADVCVTGLELDELARPRFEVRTPWGTTEVALAVSGAHMAVNAAAALAVAGVLGVDLRRAAESLAVTAISGMRMETARTPSGGLVINDAYNANPTSMRAALESLAAVPARRRIAVLGPMGELDDPAGGHRRIAELLADSGIELVAVGTDLYGVAPVDDPVAAVGPVDEGTVVLVKASRAAGLDAVARALC